MRFKLQLCPTIGSQIHAARGKASATGGISLCRTRPVPYVYIYIYIEDSKLESNVMKSWSRRQPQMERPSAKQICHGEACARTKVLTHWAVHLLVTMSRSSSCSGQKVKLHGLVASGSILYPVLKLYYFNASRRLSTSGGSQTARILRGTMGASNPKKKQVGRNFRRYSACRHFWAPESQSKHLCPVKLLQGLVLRAMPSASIVVEASCPVD